MFGRGARLGAQPTGAIELTAQTCGCGAIYVAGLQLLPAGRRIVGRALADAECTRPRLSRRLLGQHWMARPIRPTDGGPAPVPVRGDTGSVVGIYASSGRRRA